MIRKSLCPVFLLLGLLPAFGAENSVGLTAILTRVDGAVQLAGPGVERAPLARLWQVVRAGVTVRVPEGGAAGIVCSNHRFVRLHGPASWSLTEQACATGKELTPGEYAAESYRHALVLVPSLELQVTLADIYLTVGLYQRAEVQYREALAEGAPPGVRAAATFGLGRLEYGRDRFREAAAASDRRARGTPRWP